MSKSPQAAQLHHHNNRPPPQQSPPEKPTSSQSPHQKTTSSAATEPHSTKPFEFPFRYLIRDSVDPISPPPTDEAPPLKENPLENQITAPIQQTSQQPLSERDETEVFTQCESVLEDAGSPMLQMDRSPENPVVASRMAASPLATMEAKIGRGGVNGKSVESGVLRRAETKKAELGLRVLEVILCMISFSVMAADKTTGWAGDSFDRYQEFRYCVSMNVIGFVYSVFQVYAQFYWRMKRRRIIDRPLSYYLDFSMDQALAYLLMSASSSAAARNDDWISMFGNDKFTDMIKGSIAMSFLAFLAFALSSIISAEKLFSWNL